jgi:hypothetical protein
MVVPNLNHLSVSLRELFACDISFRTLCSGFDLNRLNPSFSLFELLLAMLLFPLSCSGLDLNLSFSLLELLPL